MENNYIGMAKPPKGHQALIYELCAFINNEETPFDHYAIPEANLQDGDPNSKQPDVLVLDREERENLIAIEVEQKPGIKNTLKKAKEYVDNELVLEAFVFQYSPSGFLGYEVEKIYRVSKSGTHEDETESELLDIDFEHFID